MSVLRRLILRLRGCLWSLAAVPHLIGAQGDLELQIERIDQRLAETRAHLAAVEARIAEFDGGQKERARA